ncbi:MAG: hypothetical protein HND58_13020 [Planctomycetota bacterium]|nr:MAG: hypothetical protein HND58_13020 [Planctomycetota bacterium]
MPFQTNGEPAKSADPSTWVSFEAAMSAWRAGGFDGIGYVFSEDDPYSGIDLDDCIVEGKLIPGAQAIVDAFATYSEISPSGNGVKMVGEGRKPENAGCKKYRVDEIPCVEVYDTERYFTITGQALPGTPRRLADCQTQLDALCQRLWPTKPRPAPRPGHEAGHHESVAMADRERRCVAYLGKCPDAISGQGGHDATLRAACECFRFGLDDDAVWRAMHWFNENKTGGEQWNEKELAHKIDDARTKVAEDGEFEVRLRHRESVPLRSDLERQAKQRTDVGNAARLLLQNGDKLRYSVGPGVWLIWDGKRWKADERKEIVGLCKDTALSILDEAKRADDTLRDDLLTWARASQKRERVTAMAALAEPDVAVGPDDLDANPWLFNCKNGTIDLRTGELRRHQPEDLITKLAPVEYDPDAPCPRFMAFLEEIFGGDQELIGFVQRWLGHCLTGDITEQYLMIFWGDGNNGKSVLLDTTMALMGEYAGTAAPELLVVKQQQEHPTGLADLMGKRLVLASESERGAELKLQLVKRLTGDDRIKARFMRRDFIEFDRTHKLILVTNNRPEVKEDSEAAWRRLRLVPFAVVILPQNRDRHLMSKLKREWPGILAWLVRGCLEWQRSGLGEPATVVAATEQYRGVANSLEAFIAERCTLGDGLCVKAGTLLEEYLDWCEREHRTPFKGRAWGDELKARGCLKSRLNGARHWVGIELHEPPDDGYDGFDPTSTITPSESKLAVQPRTPVKSVKSVKGSDGSSAGNSTELHGDADAGEVA